MGSLDCRPAPALMAIGLFFGCSGGGSNESAAVVVRDSAEVTIVESLRPRWGDGASWALGPPETTVGLAGAELEDVAGAVRLPDGRIVVADGGASSVHFFSADGRLLTSVGGEGDGPGEFRLIESMGRWSADTLWVHDFSHGRLTLVSEAMDVGRVITLTPALGRGRAVGLLGDGSFVVGEAWSTAGDAEAEPGLVREPVAYVRYDGVGRMLDTLAVVPGREVVLGEEGGRLTMGSVPFGHEASHTLLAGSLVLGDQIDHRVDVYAPDRGLSRSVRWAGGSMRIEEADVAEWIERTLASLPSSDPAAVRAGYADVPLPERKPAYGPILGSPDGTLWIGEYAHTAEEPRSWEVLDRDGAWLGTLPVPYGFLPLQIGSDFILGRQRDELDVQTVQLRLLRR